MLATFRPVVVFKLFHRFNACFIRALCLFCFWSGMVAILGTLSPAETFLCAFPVVSVVYLRSEVSFTVSTEAADTVFGLLSVRRLVGGGGGERWR